MESSDDHPLSFETPDHQDSCGLGLYIRPYSCNSFDCTLCFIFHWRAGIHNIQLRVCQHIMYLNIWNFCRKCVPYWWAFTTSLYTIEQNYMNIIGVKPGRVCMCSSIILVKHISLSGVLVCCIFMWKSFTWNSRFVNFIGIKRFKVANCLLLYNLYWLIRTDFADPNIVWKHYIEEC